MHALNHCLCCMNHLLKLQLHLVNTNYLVLVFAKDDLFRAAVLNCTVPLGGNGCLVTLPFHPQAPYILFVPLTPHFINLMTHFPILPGAVTS